MNPSPPSRSIEEYLEAIYKISMKEAPVKTTRLAEYLGVSPASVTEMIKKLSNMGYVRYTPYKGIMLTNKGRKLGEKVTRRHRLIEVFLNKILKISKELVHSEACKMEHTLSDVTERSLCIFLGQPSKCPHGKVIPACDLDLPSCDKCIVLSGREWDKVGKREKDLIPVSWLKEGEYGIIEFIRGDHKILRRLLDMGLTPGTRVYILRRAPLNGPIEIVVRGSRLAIGQDIASNVFIKRVDSG